MVRLSEARYQSRADEILSAATRMFARRGVTAATMQDVADEAGISVGLIYRYYPSKEQLVRAVLDRIRDSTRALFTQAAVETHSPSDMLAGAGRLLGERFRGAHTREETILVLEAVLADARRSEDLVAGRRQLREAYIFLTERLFRQAQTAGALDPGIDPEALALLFVSLNVGIHVLALETPDVIEMEGVLGIVNEMLHRFAPPPVPCDAGEDMIRVGGGAA
jgi:AcrR family transcriptional regulator